MNIKTAIDIIRPMLNQAHALVQLADVLDKIGSIENHRMELLREVEELKKVVEGMKGDIKDTEDKIERDLEVAKEKCERMECQARADARAVCQEALNESSERQAAAEEEVEKMRAEVEWLAEASKELRATVEKLTAERDSLATDIRSLVTSIRDKVSSL